METRPRSPSKANESPRPPKKSKTATAEEDDGEVTEVELDGLTEKGRHTKAGADVQSSKVKKGGRERRNEVSKLDFRRIQPELTLRIADT